MKTRIVYYFVGVVISALALTSVATLSSYAHDMDETLTATQEQLSSVQNDYDQLKAEHETLAKDFDQSRSDLETANQKVAALEVEVKTAQDQNAKLQESIKVARLNMSVLEGLFNDSTSLQEMDNRIAATGNSEMSRNWDAVSDQNSLGGFIVYLVHIVWGTLN